MSASAGYVVSSIMRCMLDDRQDDDWDTDPDFVNDVSEKDQRKGSRLINKDAMGDAVAPVLSIEEVRRRAIEQDQQHVKAPNFARGYGGVHGVEKNADQTTK